MRLLTAGLLIAAAGVAQAADVASGRPVYDEPIVAAPSPYVAGVAYAIPVPVGVVRRERWSTTYYPALPWGGLVKPHPISLKRVIVRERRYAPRVLVRKG